MMIFTNIVYYFVMNTPHFLNYIFLLYAKDKILDMIADIVIMENKCRHYLYLDRTMPNVDLIQLYL